jgi:hypothetical protein
MRSRLSSLGLSDIVDKLDHGTRLSMEDGVRLFACPDLHALGWLANREREKRHGALTYYNFNLRLEATNVCVANCLFCSFARLRPGDAEAYTLQLEHVLDKLRSRAGQPLTEIHVVNGLHPDLPFSYYTDMLKGLKAIRPGIHLKCFTAVEIAFFADTFGLTDEQVLRALHAAGLDSLPGGGAEIFAERVRKKICHDKADADRYLSIHRVAHGMGLRSNVTMLYGHIETIEERVDHMLRARALQDETGGRRRRATRCACTRWHGFCSTTSRTSRRSGWRPGSRSRRWRSGSVPTTSTGPCRRRRSTTWPARARPSRSERPTSAASFAPRAACPSSATRSTTSSRHPTRRKLRRSEGLYGSCRAGGFFRSSGS